MKPWLVEAVIAAASLVVWFGTYGLMLLATRPRHIEPAPASQELGPQPPAVVSLLANGWEVTEDAVESTLLDLAARKFYEFRQPANDPAQTTIHLTQNHDDADLMPYERSIYERVSDLAQNGLVPLTALTFRDDSEAKRWWKTVRGSIIADASERGLSRRRISSGIVTVLTIVALLAGVGIGIAVFHNVHRDPTPSGDGDPLGTAIAAGFITFLVLAAIGGRDIGQRETPEGREVAARWLGVKEWLRGNDGFADLPPSAVVVWDRYLGYGAALGTTRVASAVIDLGLGNRRRAWSSYGGTWHRVRVSYPRFWPRYGHPAGKLVFRAVLAGVLGAILVRLWRPGLTRLSTVDFVHGRWYDTVAGLIGPAGFVIGFALLAYAAYVLIRVIIDVTAPKMLAGQVLWLRVWRTRGGEESGPTVPWLYYAAIDDGSGDQTRAWGLPADLELRCHTGDTVQASVLRWSRRVVALEVTQRGSAGLTRGALPSPPSPAPSTLASSPAAGTPASPLAPLTGWLARPDVPVLLTAEEVGVTLGMRVTMRPGPATGPVSTTTFATDPGGKTVLMLHVTRGALVGALWRGHRRRGTPIPEVGDEAWRDDNRCMARSGGVVVGLALHGPAKRKGGTLPTLLVQAVSRIPRQAAPAD